MAEWLKKIPLGDVFHNEEMTFEQRRDETVRRLRSSGWLTMTADDFDLSDMFDELGETRDGNEFDEVWDRIYDQADYDRVWIGTLDQPKIASR
jgi:hypothetical protein